MLQSNVVIEDREVLFPAFEVIQVTESWADLYEEAQKEKEGRQEEPMQAIPRNLILFPYVYVYDKYYKVRQLCKVLYADNPNAVIQITAMEWNQLLSLSAEDYTQKREKDREYEKRMKEREARFLEEEERLARKTISSEKVRKFIYENPTFSSILSLLVATVLVTLVFIVLHS